MRFMLPRFLEVEPDVYKALEECNHDEFRAARARETHHSTRKELDRFYRFQRCWKEFPLMTIGDMKQQR